MSRGQDKDSFSAIPQKQSPAHGCFNGEKILVRKLMQDGELFIREPCRTSKSLRFAKQLRVNKKIKDNT
jgi:hypothetical protein